MVVHIGEMGRVYGISQRGDMIDGYIGRVLLFFNSLFD
jgi:hypothetical protein